jgi:hypothetical protein
LFDLGTLITNYTIEKISDTLIRVSWNATDLLKNCWLYMNGILITQLYDTTTLTRTYDISVEKKSSYVIEIQEALLTEPIVSINAITPKSYDLKWDKVTNAKSYKIYYRKANNAEKMIKEIIVVDNTFYYVYPIPSLSGIGGIWHHFHVESIDEWGNSSVTKEWHYFVYGLPNIPQSVKVSGGSGLFNITVNL